MLYSIALRLHVIGNIFDYRLPSITGKQLINYNLITISDNGNITNTIKTLNKS